MAQLVEYLGEEQLNVALIAEQDKKKLLVADARGRKSKLAPDKVLFRHSAASIEELSGRLDALQQDVDVPLLWETLVAEEDLSPREAVDLARVYFDDDSDAHASAVFRALLAERLHFRRRGKTFEPRSAEELEQLRQQRDSEERAERELAELSAALRKKPDPEHCERLERFLRHGGDRQLATVLEGLGKNPAREAFNLLLRAGHLPRAADMEVIQANLKPALPEEVIAHAAGLELPGDHPAPLSSAFSIDDPDTREVDDALSVHQEGELVRIDIDIADVAALVQTGDPVDAEARKRATTVYLPTGTFLMLPERLGCDLLSLHAGKPRPALRTTVWIDAQGEVQRFDISRSHINVERRLDYETADELLASGDAALKLLDGTARLLAARRRAAGSLSFQQREFKIRVSADGEEITIKPIPHDSPSRALVAEMMILTNGLAARFAEERGIPIIYRVQPPPADKPPDIDPADPAAFAKLRGLLAPATLSLQPAKHWGLGLEGYTQASSPLRRYTDLVIQRQLQAGLSGEAPPYSAEELLKVLATAEATERETKRLEATVTLRWALEYVSRLEDKSALSAWVLDAVAGGYKAMLCCCGATGLLLDSAPHEPGELVTVAVKAIKPRQGGLRMVPA
jgi:exoribonuclease-2